MYCGTCKGECLVYKYLPDGSADPEALCCHDLVRWGHCQHIPTCQEKPPEGWQNLAPNSPGTWCPECNVAWMFHD